jgi:hypothetical protein
MSSEATVKFLLTVALGIWAALMFLGAVLRREWVKADLLERGAVPIRIWWLPWTCWSLSGPAFRVIYRDSAGCKHRAYCWTSNVRPRQVQWVKDEII